MSIAIIAAIYWVNQNSWIHLQLYSSSLILCSIILQVLLPLSSKYIHKVIISTTPTDPTLSYQFLLELLQ